MGCKPTKNIRRNINNEQNIAKSLTHLKSVKMGIICFIDRFTLTAHRHYKKVANLTNKNDKDKSLALIK